MLLWSQVVLVSCQDQSKTMLRVLLRVDPKIFTFSIFTLPTVCAALSKGCWTLILGQPGIICIQVVAMWQIVSTSPHHGNLVFSLKQMKHYFNVFINRVTLKQRGWSPSLLSLSFLLFVLRWCRVLDGPIVFLQSSFWAQWIFGLLT